MISKKQFIKRIKELRKHHRRTLDFRRIVGEHVEHLIEDLEMMVAVELGRHFSDNAVNAMKSFCAAFDMQGIESPGGFLTEPREIYEYLNSGAEWYGDPGIKEALKGSEEDRCQ